MGDPLPLPDGFLVGHSTRADGATGCTVVIPPAGTRGGVRVLGGGTGTRELEPLRADANAEGPNAVLFTGGSAYGLAAADGVVRWLAERGVGRPTLVGVVPLVPTAVIFDLHAGGERPGPVQGYEACRQAAGGVPRRGAVGAGAGAAVGKALGRERATAGGVGYAAARLAVGWTVAALAVANAVGDVLDVDGSVLGGPRDERGRQLRSVELFAGLEQAHPWPLRPGESTTLACICTDAPLDKRDCGIVARMAAAGIARAVDPVFTPLDGDVVFCLASGGADAVASRGVDAEVSNGADARASGGPDARVSGGPDAGVSGGADAGATEMRSRDSHAAATEIPAAGAERSLLLSAIGAVAATVTAEAVRDAVRR